uniref:Uncharacterized protein n=1 Tax=Vibrio anguillarum serovar O2 TaxID=105260 RepID=A4Q8I2_VIBAN|nr:hypothetical protein [Vibrio anguillarum]CAJ87705.1 hypothetical protein [Vibrio anguillarum serovar O2]
MKLTCERMEETDYRKLKQQLLRHLKKYRAVVVCGAPAVGKNTLVEDVRDELGENLRNHRLYSAPNAYEAIKEMLGVMAAYDCRIVFTVQNESIFKEIHNEVFLPFFTMDNRLPSSRFNLG